MVRSRQHVSTLCHARAWIDTSCLWAIPRIIRLLHYQTVSSEAWVRTLADYFFIHKAHLLLKFSMGLRVYFRQSLCRSVLSISRCALFRACKINSSIFLTLPMIDFGTERYVRPCTSQLRHAPIWYRSRRSDSAASKPTPHSNVCVLGTDPVSSHTSQGLVYWLDL